MPRSKTKKVKSFFSIFQLAKFNQPIAIKPYQYTNIKY